MTTIDDIKQALYRGSTLIFDNLGLDIDVSTAHAAYAERIGKHPHELTNDESAQAILDMYGDMIERFVTPSPRP